MTEKITREDILHVAALARLSIDGAAVDTFSEQIATILDYVRTMNELNTDGIRPTSHAISLTNAFREDEPGPHLPLDRSLANAPDREDPYFRVPRIIG